MSGILMSSSTRSGWCSFTALTTDPPLLHSHAISTFSSFSSNQRKRFRAIRSLSAIRTRSAWSSNRSPGIVLLSRVANVLLFPRPECLQRDSVGGERVLANLRLLEERFHHISHIISLSLRRLRKYAANVSFMLAGEMEL